MTYDEQQEALYSHPARELADCMSDISEEYYCAGWMHNLENDLWAILLDYRTTGKLGSYGWGNVTLKELQRLDALQKKYDGWWYWSEEVIEQVSSSLDGTMLDVHKGETFLSTQDWEKMYADYIHNQKHL